MFKIAWNGEKISQKNKIGFLTAPTPPTGAARRGRGVMEKFDLKWKKFKLFQIGYNGKKNGRKGFLPKKQKSGQKLRKKSFKLPEI